MGSTFISCLLSLVFCCRFISADPIVVSTWNFPGAANTAYEALVSGSDHVEAAVAGCNYCEMYHQECGNSVGPGRPDEGGRTTLDAMIMNGVTHEVGAVGNLQGVQQAIEVAHAVMKYTGHSFLVGQDATDFALSMGFESAVLETNSSLAAHENWLNNNCQPNHWQNVVPDPNENCGPYSPSGVHQIKPIPRSDPDNHDTVAMVVIDGDNVAAGASTNGLNFKIKGRVGDSPIPGSGAYADEFGGAGATGNGDLMLRYSPSLMAVHYMKQGHSPQESGEMALRPIAVHHPSFGGALVVANIEGDYGAACYGYGSFNYMVRTSADEEARVENVQCFTL